MNKNKHKSKTAPIMLFSFACLALTGCTLHDTLNKPQAETIVDVVETPHKRNIIKRDPTPQQETWTITNETYTDRQWVTAMQSLGVTEDHSLSYDLNNESITLGISYSTPDLALEFDDSGTIYNAEIDTTALQDTPNIWNEDFEFTLTEYPQELYDALNPAQESMGEQIIDSVESGLGMIGTLATQFLTGFTALFWNSANSELTAFGTFSLIFLGIAITFAIIKLILNIVRSNTGV